MKNDDVCLDPGVARAEDATKTVVYGGSFGNEALPTYDKGFLLFQIRPNTVEVWNPQGQLQFRSAIDELGVGIRRVIVLERLDFRGAGRQAKQIKRRPANERSFAGFASRP